MDLRETLYYARQYRSYNQAGIVPNVTCDLCNEPYYPRMDSDDESVYLWCMFCDISVDPGYGVFLEMKRRVDKIEGN